MLQLPYKPINVLHRHGGKILEVTEMRHQTEKPSGGYSNDAWYFMGRVRWEDGSGGGDKLHPIDVPMLCSDTPEGQQEISALCELTMAYLHENGEWFDSKPHEGWYAHRRARPGKGIPGSVTKAEKVAQAARSARIRERLSGASA
jgi:hypothetical protein